MNTQQPYKSYFKYFAPWELEVHTSESAPSNDQIPIESIETKGLDVEEYDRSAKKSWTTPPISFDD